MAKKPAVTETPEAENETPENEGGAQTPSNPDASELLKQNKQLLTMLETERTARAQEALQRQIEKDAQANGLKPEDLAKAFNELPEANRTTARLTEVAEVMGLRAKVATYEAGGGGKPAPRAHVPTPAGGGASAEPTLEDLNAVNVQHMSYQETLAHQKKLEAALRQAQKEGNFSLLDITSASTGSVPGGTR